MTAQEMINLSDAIAKAMGDGWTRKVEEDGWDNSCRSHLTHRLHGELYLSNTWGGRGRLHVSGSLPHGMTTPYKWENPSITVDIAKEPAKIARDILVRLLPRWDGALAQALKANDEAKRFADGCNDLKARVAMIKNGRISGEIVYGPGNWDIQVSSPTSMRLYGPCLYITEEQLTKIKLACPELFEERRS